MLPSVHLGTVCEDMPGRSHHPRRRDVDLPIQGAGETSRALRQRGGGIRLLCDGRRLSRPRVECGDFYVHQTAHSGGDWTGLLVQLACLVESLKMWKRRARDSEVWSPFQVRCTQDSDTGRKCQFCWAHCLTCAMVNIFDLPAAKRGHYARQEADDRCRQYGHLEREVCRDCKVAQHQILSWPSPACGR